jgi:hypothetical protein
MIIAGAKRFVNYLLQGWLGIIVGLLPWVVYASIVGLLVGKAKLNVSIPFDSSGAMDQMVSIMGLLLAFLVTGNISISGQITGGVENIAGACMDLAGLTYTLLAENVACGREALVLNNYCIEMLKFIKKDELKDGYDANAATLRALRAVHELKVNGFIEPPLVGIFVKGITTITGAHGTLWTLRNSGAHPAIRITLFVIAAMNIIVNVSALAIENDATLVGAAIFISCSSVGIYTISLFIRDPLDYSVLSGGSTATILATIADVEALRDGAVSDTCLLARKSKKVARIGSAPPKPTKTPYFQLPTL